MIGDRLYAGHASDMRMVSKLKKLRHVSKMTEHETLARAVYGVRDVSIGTMQVDAAGMGLPKVYMQVDAALLAYTDKDGVEYKIAAIGPTGEAVDDNERDTTVVFHHVLSTEEMIHALNGGYYDNPRLFEERVQQTMRSSLFKHDVDMAIQTYELDDATLRMARESGGAYDVSPTSDFDLLLGQSFNVVQQKLEADMHIRYMEASKPVAKIFNPEDVVMEESEFLEVVVPREQVTLPTELESDYDLVEDMADIDTEPVDARIEIGDYETLALAGEDAFASAESIHKKEDTAKKALKLKEVQASAEVRKAAQREIVREVAVTKEVKRPSKLKDDGLSF